MKARVGRRIALVSGLGLVGAAYSTVTAQVPAKRLYVPMVTRDSTPTPVPSAVTYRDDFSSAASGWQVVDVSTLTLAYVDGEYQAVAKGASSVYTLFSPAAAATDMQVEVDGRALGSNSGGLGVFFAFGASTGQYIFEIIPAVGTYRLRIATGVYGQTRQFTTLLGPTASSAIRTGTASNRVRAVHVGSSIELYVNDQRVAALEHSSLTRGFAGLFVGTGTGVPYEVRFDNFVLVRNSLATREAVEIARPLIEADEP